VLPGRHRGGIQGRLIGLRILAAAACLLGADGAGAQMYKCVDARGVTHYSDKPRPDCKGAEVDIRGQPPISGKIETYGSDVGAAERDFLKRQQQREREAQEQSKSDETRQRRCERAKAERQNWTAHRRVFVTDDKGERRYLDDNERAAKTAQLDAVIARDCR
jgi:hypothetical protein